MKTPKKCLGSAAPPRAGTPPSRRAAFTLVELLVSTAVIALILLLIVSMTDTVAKTWVGSEKRIESYQNARASLELMTREMSSAMIDVCRQFVVLPAETLHDKGAEKVVPNSHAAIWFAPLGKDGDLRKVGYYLERDLERNFYRLKRIYVGPENEDYFPPIGDLSSLDPLDVLASDSQADAVLGVFDEDAFNDADPGNDRSIVGTVAEGVIAMWIQCIDVLGNPIPWASAAKNSVPTSLIFNSASRFHMASSVPFEDGKSFVYLANHANATKGNKIPAAVEITLVTLDSRSLALELEIPDMINILTEDGALDIEASKSAFEEALARNGIHDARVFSSRVKLMKGG